MPPSFAVVICAYTEDRWDDLLGAVDSARAQTLPAREIVVVIDHNPTLLQRAKVAVEGAVVIANDGAQGLSGARNSGVRASSGDVVAFLDDDALADADWLERLAEGYTDPKVVGVGGSITPLWQAPRPGWFPQEFDWVVGCTYRGMPESVTEVRNLIGANMSFRREVFDAGFAFEVGQVGGSMLRCDDTEFCIRIRQAWPDRPILYWPAAHVRHRVTAGRARWSYFRERCYTEGIAKAGIARLVGAGDGLAAERAHALRALPRGVALEVREAVSSRDGEALGRAGAIVVGLGLTTAGYAVGAVRAKLRRGDRDTARSA